MIEKDQSYTKVST